MSDYQGNIVIKNPATPAGPGQNGAAPGMWKLSEAMAFKRQGIWPTQGILSADPLFPYVSLLLSTTSLGNANNNLFVDSSGAFNPVSRNGNTAQGSFSPYGLSWSNYFDGSGDRLSLAGNAAFAIATSSTPFTIECWIYPTAAGGCIFSEQWTGSGNIPISLIMGDGSTAETNGRFVTIGAYNGSSWALTRANTQVTLNAWTHVAAVFTGSTSRIYYNGVDVTAASPVTSWPVTGQAGDGWFVGQRWDTVGVPYFSGYISNLRFVNGTAVYTSAFTPPTAPLTAITNTVLLTCQSNRFRDASANNFAITVTGDTRVSDFIPFAPAFPGISYNQNDITNWSAYFDGSGDYLVAPSNPAFAYGTGDFTIECWGYRRSSSDFWCGYSSNGISFTLFSYAGGNIQVFSSGFYDSGINPGYGNWFHVAVTRSGGTLRIYVNGVLGFSGAYTTNITQHSVNIGMSTAGETGVGYISNLRVVKGTAVYTGASLTVPTAPLTAIANTSLLTCQNAAFTDNSTNSLPIGIFGNATVTGNNPFQAGLYSNYFDGSGDWITTPNVSAFDLSSSSVNFTIEAWIYNSDNPTYNGIIGARQNGVGQGWCLYIHPNNTLYMGSLIVGNGYADRQMNTTVIPKNTWAHIALVKTASGYTAYVNGVGGSLLALTGGLDYQAAQPVIIGALGSQGEYPFTGYISNARIVKGTAVYTSNFTPSTTPLTAITNTSLLTCQSARFVDNSSNAFTITVSGNTSIQPFDPFYTSAIASNGGSMYLDGTGDYLVTPSSPTTAAGSSDLTIECWVTFGDPTASTDTPFYGNYIGAWTTNAIYWGKHTGVGGRVALWIYNYSTAGPLLSDPNFPSNAWNHYAITRSGSTWRMFRDGVVVATATWAGDASGTNGVVAIGRADVLHHVGYISDFRFTKAALYTATFTPPTAPLTPSASTGLLVNGMNAGIYDATAINNLETVNDTRVFYPTPFAPTNYWAGAFDGSGDYLTTPSNSAFALGTGDYTVECWIYATSNPSDVGIYEGRSTGSATDGFTLTAFSSSVIRVWSGGALISSSGTSYVGQWVHVAVTRASGTTTLWINGVSQGTSTTSYNCTNTDAVVGGGRYTSGSSINTSFPGLISNFRIVKGTAVYTAAFTPPPAPLTAIANTSLLTCQNTTFIDNSTNAFTITAFGNATAGAVGPFTATGGTSVYFDGTTDYMVVSGNKADWTWVHNGQQNWTIEFWSYNVNTNSMGVFCTNTNSTNGAYGAVMGLNSMNGAGSIGGHFTRGVDGARMDWYTAGNILVANRWNHVALQFNVTTKNMEVYLNGVSQSVTNQNVVGNSPTGGDGSAFAYSNEPPTFNPNLGRVVGPVTVANYFNGYIEDMRITRGFRRYTANFTPPTTPFAPY